MGAVQEDRKEGMGSLEGRPGPKARSTAQEDSRRATCLSLRPSHRVTPFSPPNQCHCPMPAARPPLTRPPSVLPAGAEATPGLEGGGGRAETPKSQRTPTGLKSF